MSKEYDGQDACERFSFIVDDGGDGEYHVDFSIPCCLSAQEKEKVVLGVFDAEQLPEWSRHSFLAVASRLLSHSERDSNAGGGGEEGGGRGGDREGDDDSDLLPVLSIDEVSALVDRLTSMYGPSFLSSSYHSSMSIAKSESQLSPIDKFSMLMRDVATSKPVLDLMRVFWEDGMSLAKRRIEVSEGLDKEYEREQQSIILRGAFLHEEEVKKQLETLKMRYREKKKVAGRDYRRSLSRMQEAQRNDFSSYMNVIQREAMEQSEGETSTKTPESSPDSGVIPLHEDPMDVWDEVFGGRAGDGTGAGDGGAETGKEETSKGLWSTYGKFSTKRTLPPRCAIELVSWVGTSQLRSKVRIQIRPSRILDYCVGPSEGQQRRSDGVMRGITGDNLLGIIIPVAHPSSSSPATRPLTAASFVEGCCSSAELLAPDLPAQLDSIRKKLNAPFLEVGQWCSTWHTNLVAAHVAFHLVVESSPHPVNPDSKACAGLKSVVRAAARQFVTGLAVPILLTETSAEGASSYADGLCGSAEMEGNLSKSEKLMIRSTAVMRCLWEEVRASPHIKALHILVPSEDKKMMEIAETAVRSVCRVDAKTVR